MKVVRLVFALIVVVSMTVVEASEQPGSVVRGPYLGQTPPGPTPEIFAPAVVSGPFDERMAVFIDFGERLLYQLRGVPQSVIVEMEATDNGWTKPKVASFSGRYFAEFGVSPDGCTVILASDRPVSGTGPPDKMFRAYRVTRSDDGSWTEPEPLGENLDGIGHPSIAANGNLYVFRYHRGGIGFGKADLYVSRLGADGYTKPINLGESINSEHFEVDPYIAPDESFFIFASSRQPSGLYISFRDADGLWTPARYMGDALAAGDSICPWVTPDGRFLFFTSNRISAAGRAERTLGYREKLAALNAPGNGSNDIYWVDAGIIERMKRETLSGSTNETRRPVAELFSPDIISTVGDEAVLAVVGDGAVCYLTRSDPGFDGPWMEIPVLRSERRDGMWSEPEVAGSSGEPWYLAYREAVQGERVHFAWMSRLDGSGPSGDIDLWSVEMTATGWSDPVRLPCPINLEGVDSWPVATDSGVLYFFSNRPGGLGQGDLYRAVGVKTERPVVEHLGGGVNSPAMEHDPCVASDESFLVFASDRTGGFGGNDLYVSFPTPAGDWSEPVNLGPGVNSADEDARPVLSRDGTMLYFTRQSADGMDIYRVSASVVEVAGRGNAESSGPSGPYLGEASPGTTPRIVADTDD